MTAPFAPPPNALQWMILSAIPLVFIGGLFSTFGQIGRWIAMLFFVVAMVLIWGAMFAGFYMNVVLPWWRGETCEKEKD